MKHFFIVLLVSLSIPVMAQEDNLDMMDGYGESSLNWYTDLQEARTQASKEKKPILIYFSGSDWCGPCKSLKKDFFNSDRFEKIANDFVLLLIDIPRRTDVISKAQLMKNKKVLKKYNSNEGFPNVVVLNSQSRKVGELSGYTLLRETDTHFSFVESMRDKY